MSVFIKIIFGLSITLNLFLLLLLGYFIGLREGKK